MYSDDMRIWNALFEIFVKDLAVAETEGVYVGQPYGRVFPIVLGNKGDWSYLVSGQGTPIFIIQSP